MRPVLPVNIQECLQAAADGLTMAQERTRYRVSHDTVKSRRRLLCEVLQAGSLSQAVHHAHELGLLDRKPREMPAVVLADGAPVAELWRARLVLGWSRGVAAARVGRSALWLRARECGEKPFSWAELGVYADALGVDLAEDAR